LGPRASRRFRSYRVVRGAWRGASGVSEGEGGGDGRGAALMGGGQGDEGDDVRLKEKKQQGGSASSPSKAACQCGDRDAHAFLSRDVAAHVYQAQ